MTKQNLQHLSKKYELSQSELIEVMCEFAERSEFDFSIIAKGYKIKNNPAYKKFESEYNKLNPEEQQIMRQKLMENGFEFEN
jgi:hypothetical protein